MSIAIKPGVRFDVIAPAGYMILSALKHTSKALAVDLTITSGTDGMHSGLYDPHNTGEAYDIRTKDLDPSLKWEVLETLMTVLGRERFFGFLESPGRPNEHIHCQRKIGTRYTVEDFLNAE